MHYIFVYLKNKVLTEVYLANNVNLSIRSINLISYI